MKNLENLAHRYQVSVMMEGHGYSATIFKDGEQIDFINPVLSEEEAKRLGKNLTQRNRRFDHKQLSPEAS
jgi:hypothetical protein